jgi:hypothetical protein
LYSLIWKRTVACQMAPAVFDTVAVELLAGTPQAAAAKANANRTVLRANGSTLVKPGYISVYQEGMDDVVQDDSDHVLPPMKEGDQVNLVGVVPTSISPNRRRASRKRRWSRRWRSTASAGRRPMRPSFPRCATASTSTSRAGASPRRTSAKSSAGF